MADPRFFAAPTPMTLAELAETAEADIRGETPDGQTFIDVMPLQDAGSHHVSFLDNPLYISDFSKSAAGACLVHPKFIDRAPGGMALLVTRDPYRAYARVAQALYPVTPVTGEISANAIVDPSAVLGEGVHIDAGAVIGARVEIGPNSRVSSNAVVARGCKIGSECHIGPGANLSYCIIGNRVIVHAGVAIGQDGFGFAPGAESHLKVPQLGRVIVEDDVEIGANACVDRGTGPDTIIGAGSKIDNLVQIGHNVRIGRGCLIAAQTGISGSTRLGNLVMSGGQSGFAGHLLIGDGVKVAGQAGVIGNIEPGVTVGGMPARPLREFWKEVAFVKRLMKKKAE